MDELQQVYLIATFPDASTLLQAARALNMPANHLAVLGGDQSGAAALAEELGVPTELNDDIPLDKEQATQLEWYVEKNERPLLAVEVMAVQGRDVRLRLTEMGGEMITAPLISDQANDAVFDPGMTSGDPDKPRDDDKIWGPN